jgi:hypothetical protein
VITMIMGKQQGDAMNRLLDGMGK